MATENGQIAINISSSGDNIVVAPDNSRQIIYVNSFTLSFAADTAAVATFKSGSRALSGPVTFLDWVQDPREGAPIYITDPGQNLIINLGAAGTLGGTLWITRQP